MVNLLLASNFRAGGLNPFERVRPKPQKGAFPPNLSPPNVYCGGGLYHIFSEKGGRGKNGGSAIWIYGPLPEKMWLEGQKGNQNFGTSNFFIKGTLLLLKASDSLFYATF